MGGSGRFEQMWAGRIQLHAPVHVTHSGKWNQLLHSNDCMTSVMIPCLFIQLLFTGEIDLMVVYNPLVS
jgi:hypothetical protein